MSKSEPLKPTIAGQPVKDEPANSPQSIADTISPSDTAEPLPAVTIDLVAGTGGSQAAGSGLSSLGATVDMPGPVTGFSPTIAPSSTGSGAAPITPATRSSGSAALRPEVEGYQVLAELGRGGMGVVYKARQTKLNRIVALKMVLAGAHAGTDQLARFYTEAEAVAHLQHPNIVQIYEVGEHSGLPYFSLEYVDGGSLSERIGGKPQPVEEAAGQVAALAQAMAYAHEHGIIHRDLKPANVLLTRDGQPKITDFGLAKRLESDSSQTKSGTLMGTPNYMAPEQARGEVKEVGPLADVYALGVILYEMLTGRTPFLGSSILDTLQQVRNHEPVPPSRLQPKVPRDLETICLKSLEKDPAKRYTTAGTLADDLYRFLAGEPILARPVSAPERLWRWCLRNKRVAALSAAVLLLLVSLAIGSTTAAFVVSRQAEQVRQQKVAAESARDDARKNEQKAVAARIDADQNAEIARGAQKQAETAKHQAEENAVRADQNAQRAEKQRELALGALDTLVTKVQSQLGDTARTFRLKRDLLETAFDGLNKVAEASGGDDGGADATRAEAHLRMGRIFVELGHSDSARKEYTAAADIYRRLHDADSKNPQITFNLARALSRVASVCLLLGDAKTAEEQAQQALQLRAELFKAIPRADMARNLARAHLQMGDVLRDVQRSDEAATQFTEALKIQEGLLPKTAAKDRSGLESELRATCERLGELHLVWKNDPQAAQKFYEQSLAIAQAAADSADAGKTARQNLAGTLSRLGMVSQRLKDREAAARYFEKSLSLWQQLAAEEDPDVLLAQSELALALARAGQHAAAARQAEHLEKLSPDYARNLYNVGCCYALCAEAVQKSAGDKPLGEEYQAARQAYVAKAVESLQRYLQLSGKADSEYMRIDPDLDSLREEQSFQKLFERAAKTP
jgi:serine/threonine-protein kinase